MVPRLPYLPGCCAFCCPFVPFNSPTAKHTLSHACAVSVMGGFGRGFACFQFLRLIVGCFGKRHQNSASALPISCVAMRARRHVCPARSAFSSLKNTLTTKVLDKPRLCPQSHAVTILQMLLAPLVFILMLQN